MSESENETTPKLENWSDFVNDGEYLKASEVKEFPLIVVPIHIYAQFDEGKAKITIEVEYKGKKRKIGLNKTNQNFIKNSGLMPKDIIGKKFFFQKIRVNNPVTKTAVDSFELSKIE